MVDACSTCGSPQLSDAARGLPLTWLSRLIAMLLLLLVWKTAILPNLSAIVVFLSGVALWCAAVMTNSSPGGIRILLLQAVRWLFTLWVVGHLMRVLPGEGGGIGRWLRDGMPLALWRHLTHRVLPAIIRGLGRLLYWLLSSKNTANDGSGNHSSKKGSMP